MTKNSHLDALLGVDSSPSGPPRDPYEDMRCVLRTPEGLRVYAKLLVDLGVGASSWRPNSSIYKDTALKDFGDAIMTEIAEADEQLFIKLQYAIRAFRRKPNE